jgi:hypothetical protein
MKTSGIGALIGALTGEREARIMSVSHWQLEG